MDELKKLTAEEFEQKLLEIVTDGVTKNMQKVGEVVSEKVNEKVKELGLDKIDLKHRMFPGVAGGDDPAATKQQRCAKFVKAVFNKDAQVLAEMKAMNEGTDSAGGYLVPEEFASEIDRIAEDFGLVRKLARRVPMKRDIFNMPVLGSAASVTWPGEGGAGSDGSPTLQSVKLNAKTAVGLCPMTSELLADAEGSVIDMVLELFAEALSGEEDNQGFNGSGAPFTGILNQGDVTVVTMGSGDTAFTDIDLNDLRDLKSQIKQTALPGAAYFMHRAVWGIVEKITEGSQHVSTFQNPIVTAAGQEAKLMPAGYIWGEPVYLTDKITSTSAVSTKFVVFGNPKYLYFGDRQQMTLDISEHATVGSINAFEQSYSIARVRERVALEVGIPTGFAVLKTAAS